MNYGRGAIMGGTLGGMAIGQQAPAMNRCSVPLAEVEVREVEGEMSILNNAIEGLGHCVSDLDKRLAPVLRQVPIGESTSKQDSSPASPLGIYLADKTASMQHLTRRVHSILERLAI